MLEKDVLYGLREDRAVRARERYSMEIVLVAARYGGGMKRLALRNAREKERIMKLKKSKLEIRGGVDRVNCPRRLVLCFYSYRENTVVTTTI